MEKFNLWCKLAASVSVMSAVLMLIVPEDKLKKAFNTLLTVILVFALMYPLKGKKEIILSLADAITFSDNSNYESEIDSYKNSALIYAAQTETEAYLKKAFSDLGIECDCSVICSYSNEVIFIENVSITGVISAADKVYIIEKINEISNKETKVIFNGEQYG